MSKDMQIKDFIAQLAPMTDQVWQLVAPFFLQRHCPKGDFICRIDEPVEHFSVLIEGVTRGWYEKGSREYTAYFHTAPGLTGCDEAFISNNTAGYHVECLTDCTIFSIEKARLNALIEDHEEVKKWYKQMSGAVLMKLLQIHHNLHALSPVEKLNQLRSQSPVDVEQWPNDYLATYLGVSPLELQRLL